MVICPTKNCIVLGDYIFDNYTEGTFLKENWVHLISENIITRITNGAEIFHQDFYSEFTLRIRLYL